MPPWLLPGSSAGRSSRAVPATPLGVRCWPPQHGAGRPPSCVSGRHPSWGRWHPGVRFVHLSSGAVALGPGPPAPWSTSQPLLSAHRPLSRCLASCPLCPQRVTPQSPLKVAPRLWCQPHRALSWLLHPAGSRLGSAWTVGGRLSLPLPWGLRCSPALRARTDPWLVRPHSPWTSHAGPECSLCSARVAARPVQLSWVPMPRLPTGTAVRWAAPCGLPLLLSSWQPHDGEMLPPFSQMWNPGWSPLCGHRSQQGPVEPGLPLGLPAPVPARPSVPSDHPWGPLRTQGRMGEWGC